MFLSIEVKLMKRDKYIVTKGELALYEKFHLLQQCFQKSSVDATLDKDVLVYSCYM